MEKKLVLTEEEAIVLYNVLVYVEAQGQLNSFRNIMEVIENILDKVDKITEGV